MTFARTEYRYLAFVSVFAVGCGPSSSTSPAVDLDGSPAQSASGNEAAANPTATPGGNGTLVVDASVADGNGDEVAAHLSCAADGSVTTVTTIATRGGDDEVFGLAVDGQGLYALVDVTGTGPQVQRVVRVSSPCGTPVVLAESPSHSGEGITVAQGRVYWAGQQGIMSVPVAGGAIALVAATTLSFDAQIVVHGDQIYWSDGAGNLSTVPLAGGTPRLLASGVSVGFPAGAFAVDDANVYWTTSGTPGDSGMSPQDGAATAPTGSLLEAPLAGGPTTTLASQLQNPRDPVVSGGTIYWIDGSTSGVDYFNKDGAVLMMSIPGGSPVLLSSGEEGPSGLTLVGPTLYWVNGAGSSFGASIRRVSAGSAPSDVVPVFNAGQFGIAGFAVDATRAYWSIASYAPSSDLVTNIFSTSN